MITAIDFTDPNKSHHLTSNELNQFQKSILSVGSILARYDTDSKYPVFGFGGEVTNNRQFEQSFFPLTFDANNICVSSVDEILNAYKNAFSNIKRSKSANFSPIIKKASEMATSFASSSKLVYTVLLILTEGEISDMKLTINNLVDASKSPLSIIIVGMGSSNFEKMEFLDADDEPIQIKNTGRMARDLVQFVPFERYQKLSKITLEKEVLAELPSQVHNYYASQGLVPQINE